MEEEKLDIVDENDNVLYVATKSEMREKNLLHRGCAIIVYNSKGEIFVHKRVKDKKIYPGFYDMFAGGGIQAGETYKEGAKRETEEELGIKDPLLKFLFKDRFTNDEDDVFASVYSCVYDGEIVLQKEEIEFGKFMSVKKLEELMKKETFCPDAIVYYEKIKNL